jgi:hypothetical protein
MTKTKFMEGLVIANKALDTDSSYHKMLQKFQSVIVSMYQNGTLPDEVAKVILRAVTTNPGLRYTVGEDAATLIDTRKKMSDAEFHNLILQNILK